MGTTFCHYLFPVPRTTLPSPEQLEGFFRELYDRRWLPREEPGADDRVLVDGYPLVEEEGRLWFPNSGVNSPRLNRLGVKIPHSLDAEWFRQLTREEFALGIECDTPPESPPSYWPFREPLQDADHGYYDLGIIWCPVLRVDAHLTSIDTSEYLGPDGSPVSWQPKPPPGPFLRWIREILGLDWSERQPEGDPVIRCGCGAVLNLPPKRPDPLDRKHLRYRASCEECGSAFEPTSRDWMVEESRDWMVEDDEYKRPLRGGTFYRFLLTLWCDQAVPRPYSEEIRVRQNFLELLGDSFGCGFDEYQWWSY